MPRIAWVDDEQATGQLAEIFTAIKSWDPRGEVPAILRTMSLRPDFLAAIVAALPLHFSDGALSVAQHEMIASWVSALTRCHY